MQQQQHNSMRVWRATERARLRGTKCRRPHAAASHCRQHLHVSGPHWVHLLLHLASQAWYVSLQPLHAKMNSIWPDNLRPQKSHRIKHTSHAELQCCGNKVPTNIQAKHLVPAKTSSGGSNDNTPVSAMPLCGTHTLWSECVLAHAYAQTNSDVTTQL